MDKLEDRTEIIAVLRVQINDLRDEVHALANKVGSLQKALYTTALSVTGAAVVGIITVLQFSGH